MTCRSRSIGRSDRCLACSSLADDLHHKLVIERFCEKGESSRIECGLAYRRIVSSANEDDPCLGRISAEIVATGSSYDNRFISIVTIEGRKIVQWRDYMDSLAAMTALSEV